MSVALSSDIAAAGLACRRSGPGGVPRGGGYMPRGGGYMPRGSRCCHVAAVGPSGAPFTALCFYVLGAFLPSLPGWCRHADPRIKSPPESGVVRARVEPGDRRSGLACLADASGDGGRRGKVDGDDVIGAASLWSGRRSDRIWFFDATMRIAARARVVRVRHTDRGELGLVLERAEIPRAVRRER